MAQDAKDRTKGHRIIRHTHNVENPLGKWNTKIVRCEGPSVSVLVNGPPPPILPSHSSGKVKLR